MGYDYYGSFSKNTGPVTPFVDSKAFGIGLQSSVKYYLNKGVHKNKLIVGLPYYGSEWYTKSRHIGATVEKFRSHPTYSTIKNVLIDSLNASVKFDSVSLSSYIVVKGESNNYRQLFFEDEKSLSLKYDWVKENDIGGVGIWALGYDQGYPELWNLLHEKFSKE
jgi:spore germination protein YaaH